MSISEIPPYDYFFAPVIQALKEIGGSGTNDEINEKVYEIVKLPDELLQISHGGNGRESEVDYRLAWTRTYLKKAGLLENSGRGVWALTNSEINDATIDGDNIKKIVRDQWAASRTVAQKPSSSEMEDEYDETSEEEIEQGGKWRTNLLDLLCEISPSAFERLAQRILRESGFSHVEVTGKSGDGGIDGKGIFRMGGFLNFHVIFQCKRHKESVPPSQIRAFRGAMQGRTEKGLFITTGTFTREAIKEATRDGAPPIDLIDGELLCEKLKELRLGVEIKVVEEVEINKAWFEKI